MPAGNGTGPFGMGSMTGRAAGRCAGYGVPGYMNVPARGYGGWGQGNRRGGRGQGFAWASPRSYPYANTTNEAYEVSGLEQQVKSLADSVERLHKDIADLKSQRDAD